TVQTSYGTVQGYETDLCRVFYGIPYAQPPVGLLRWSEPVAIGSWASSTIDGTQIPPACPQSACDANDILCPKSMSEDCLYMNIFTPLNSVSSNLPVMIFIHGGNFQYSSASIAPYNADRFVNTTNVISVFIQYRLGILGFLAKNTSSNDLKGNYGLLDQQMAIAWVKSNINTFGGDPNKITLFGQSAGAQSTAIHYLRPEMQQYFQAAIIQSCPVTIPFRTYNQYLIPNILLAQQLNCIFGDISCLRACSYQSIIAAQNVINSQITSLQSLQYFEPWTPVIDNNIVRGQIFNMFSNIFVQAKPLIIGTMTEEALSYVYSAFPNSVSPLGYIAAGTLLFGSKFVIIALKYPPQGLGDQRPLLAKLVTQWVFACPTRFIARKVNAFTYAFGYPLHTNGLINAGACEAHACHGFDLAFLFEAFWLNSTANDQYISQTMANYWTNYAKTKNPNNPVLVPVTWTQLGANPEKYLYFQNPVQIITNYLKSDCDFWDTIGYSNTLV
ncbi:unnamed protein product, partial [Rotaria sp. Silwood2]